MGTRTGRRALQLSVHSSVAAALTQLGADELQAAGVVAAAALPRAAAC